MSLPACRHHGLPVLADRCSRSGPQVHRTKQVLKPMQAHDTTAATPLQQSPCPGSSPLAGIDPAATPLQQSPCPGSSLLVGIDPASFIGSMAKAALLERAPFSYAWPRADMPASSWSHQP